MPARNYFDVLIKAGAGHLLLEFERKEAIVG
jgi:hypothetical protein